MRQIIQFEVQKIFKRPRTYIAFAAIAALTLVIQFGLKFDGETYTSFMMRDINEALSIDGKILNGYLVCYILLQMLLVHVPLLVSLIAADIISGEANLGTWRMLLVTPFGRGKWVLGKYIAASIYTLLLLIFLAICALFLSLQIFGTDDLFLMKTNYVVLIEKNDVMWRYFAAFGFASISLMTVAALGLLMSSIAKNSVGPIVATISIIVFLTILGTLNIPLFNMIKPYLFTTHMNNWKEFFDVQMNDRNVAIVGSVLNMKKVFVSITFLIIHIIGFVAAAIFITKKKDVLC
ncbi:MAG: ABC transporter permease [Chitinophagaceae bacterium]